MKAITKQEVPAFLKKWKGARTILEASREIGIAPQTYHLWARGEGFPSDENLAKMGYQWAIIPK